MTPGPIVVGVDGSAPSLDALRWAVGQARLTGDAIEVVSAWWPPSAYGGFPVIAEEDWQQNAERALETALFQVPETADVTSNCSVVPGHPVSVLLEQAAGASLLVVGSRGHGGFTGMLLGSVSQHLVAHAPCPVVVVRHETSTATGEAAATVG
jgi:nucleotide-binding universal stress UspA family protein